ncbi:outer membrane beta-barrel protein [Microbulbifer thermotolerans]|uniref:outer membrane protein n=1 Tax=Microbulbifer thermotolerans TaxID=252514 RepID=UPI0026713D1E|nr:outer membrane beta-barrel protein [Microbulbifer thermotolerans]WKT62276.1 outer membrane beta-barrel protein [Microbulbifer thermotolerans]
MMFRVVVLLVSMWAAVAAAQGYEGQRFEFDTVVSVGAGKVELEDLDGDQTMMHVATAFDFVGSPFEIELRYSRVSDEYSYGVYDGGALLDRITVDGAIDNWGIAAKLDLSWHCRDFCAYLIAGYNFTELSVDADWGGERIDYSTGADYMHWGAGLRYYVSPNLRASVEYLSYNIGKQKLDDAGGVELGSVDFGTATAWEAGIGYKF